MRIGWAKCQKCGTAYVISSGHKCASESGSRFGSSLDREESPGSSEISSETRKESSASPSDSKGAKFDRNAYQREYMRAWRKRRKAEKDRD